MTKLRQGSLPVITQGNFDHRATFFRMDILMYYIAYHICSQITIILLFSERLAILSASTQRKTWSIGPGLLIRTIVCNAIHQLGVPRTVFHR